MLIRKRFLAGVSLLVCVGCGSNSTATAPSASPTTTVGVLAVAVSGIINFAATGATSQFTAIATLTDGSKEDVTSRAGWQSSNAAVATVTPLGLVASVALGTATISATYVGKTGSEIISVGGGTGAIAGCGVFSGPGRYTLAGDLTPTATFCLRFTNNIGGELDCLGHDAGSIDVISAQNFAIRNCRLHAQVADTSGRLLNLQISTSSQVVVDSVDEFGQVRVLTCTACTFSHDSFVYPKVGFVVSGGFVSCELCFSDGANNEVFDSTIDGGYDGNFATYQRQGCDDGIGLNREVNLAIHDNVIRSAFDAGIEPGTSNGPMTVTIRDNRILNMGYTGIGSYYIEGFINSIIAGNVVSSSPSFARFSADPATGVTASTLVNNQIVNNMFVNPIALPPLYGGGIPPSIYVNMNGRSATSVSGNLIQNNNFGTVSPGPVLSPASGFIDGGANVCASVPVLNCAGGS